MSFKYSVVCDTLKWVGWDLIENPREILTAIRDAGYDGADLPGDPVRVNPRVFRPVIEELGLKVPEILGAWAYFHAGENRDLAGADERARQRGIAYSKKAIDLAAQLGAQFFQICAAQPPVPQVPFPELPIETLRGNFTRAVSEICDYASDRAITILFEPLNLYEAYPGVMTSVHDAIRVINELDRDNLGVQPDVFHMNISESSITDALRAAGKRIKVVHMNETNHYGLGAGHADFTAIVRTLKEIDFQGYVSVYMPLVSQEAFDFSPAGYGRSGSARTGAARRPDLKSVLNEQLTFLKKVEQAVEADSLARAT